MESEPPTTRLSVIMSHVLSRVRGDQADRVTEKWRNAKLSEIKAAYREWSWTALQERWLDTLGKCQSNTERWVGIIYRNRHSSNSLLANYKDLHDEDMNQLSDLEALEADANGTAAHVVVIVRAER